MAFGVELDGPGLYVRLKDEGGRGPGELDHRLPESGAGDEPDRDREAIGFAFLDEGALHPEASGRWLNRNVPKGQHRGAGTAHPLVEKPA